MIPYRAVVPQMDMARILVVHGSLRNLLPEWVRTFCAELPRFRSRAELGQRIREEVNCNAMAKVESITGLRARSIAEENRQLKERMGEIYQRLHENEQLFARLSAIETRVVQSPDPASLCLLVVTELKQEFELDLVRFALVEDGALAVCNFDALHGRHLQWVRAQQVAELALDRYPVRLLDVSHRDAMRMMQSGEGQIGSLALLRLGPSDAPLGVLLLGSAMRDRFSPDKSTDLLQHLARMIGVSLEHCVARDHLVRLSVRDAETGCYNHRFLQPMSRHSLSQWFGASSPVSACCMGAVGADGALISAARLHEALCALPRPGGRRNDPLVRMDHGQFVRFLAGCDRERAVALAQQLVREIDLGEGVLQVGVATAEDLEGTEIRTLVEQAEHALFVARALGGSRVEVACDEA